ncbi:MAG: fumarylacetoacetate hydrolase family protein [Armatimonadota bacterium]|nr:fumarylacetoacetate hydrolase family protein [Armatimonadota bacterium]MDR7486668.1 fumarylacetoacetate hydrolase family protein [Armatimonadota bacterium]MDR7534678.1 fumarylacetoacetate hydrolase family protein [Armatimonadota bacterium]MDR7535079.1 fumarylacetoacetate hydrolase family protein [Armatimonadota bacterium]
MIHARIVHNHAVLDARVEGEVVVAGDVRLPVTGATFAPPCVPTKIICVGFNYQDHAAELAWEPPAEPLLFLKPPSALVGHDAPIPYPPHTRQLEYEAELAVVIGQRCRRVPRARALDVVWGYTAFNDITARDVQRTEQQWVRAKAFDASAPLGPWIVTGVDPGALDLAARVNGETKQSSNTRSMIFDVPTLIEVVSSIMTLERGDVIATGTPKGVGPLQPGDVVEVEVGGVGVLRNRVVAGA